MVRPKNGSVKYGGNYQSRPVCGLVSCDHPSSPSERSQHKRCLAEIGHPTRQLGVATGSGNEVGHSNVVLFVDGRGHIAERYTGVELDPERIIPKLHRSARVARS